MVPCRRPSAGGRDPYSGLLWKLLIRYSGTVRLFNSRHSGLALDVSAVNEEILHIAIGFKKIGLGDVSGHRDSVGIPRHLKCTARGLLAEYEPAVLLEAYVGEAAAALGGSQP